MSNEIIDIGPLGMRRFLSMEKMAKISGYVLLTAFQKGIIPDSENFDQLLKDVQSQGKITEDEADLFYLYTLEDILATKDTSRSDLTNY